MTIKAIFFDQDGVLIDTERDGHRVAYNKAFKQEGFDFHWDLKKYSWLLSVTGGKERLRLFFETDNLFPELTVTQVEELVSRIHERKTAIFIDLIKKKELPLRSGIKRLMQEAMEAGLMIGICTASDQRSANAIATTMLASIDFHFILAGDMVTRKKPDPEIYLRGLEKAGIAPEECLVVEDSQKGLQAAKSAGIRTIVTTNMFTEDEDLQGADIIVSRLGEADGKKGVLKYAEYDFDFDGVVYLSNLLNYFQHTGSPHTS
ncbi:MAG: HAD-IA family hydrolase [Thermodesulfobacteriota bacterium]